MIPLMYKIDFLCVILSMLNSKHVKPNTLYTRFAYFAQYSQHCTLMGIYKPATNVIEISITRCVGFYNYRGRDVDRLVRCKARLYADGNVITDVSELQEDGYICEYGYWSESTTYMTAEFIMSNFKSLYLGGRCAGHNPDYHNAW